MIASMPVNTARALLRFASEDVTRPYLAGFWIEPSGVAVASDGACLLAVRGLHVDFRPAPVLVPARDLGPFLKGRKGAETLVIERGALRVGTDSRAVSLAEAANFPGQGGNGPTLPYMDWRRIIPQAISGRVEYDGKNGVERTCLDSRLLERLRVALGELNGKSPANSPPVFPMPNGAAAAVLETPENVLAVLMPMRTGKRYNVPDINTHCGSWARQTQINETGGPLNNKADA